MLRAYTPWPGLYGSLEGERIKILSALPGLPSDRKPGTLFQDKGLLLVACGDGMSLELRSVQRGGGRPVTGPEFARGWKALPAQFSQP
jgi:methionyl-tRNA formyltransferase